MSKKVNGAKCVCSVACVPALARNKKYNTKFNMPIVYYSTLMSVAYGKNLKASALDGQIIRAKKLEDIANK